MICYCPKISCTPQKTKFLRGNQTQLSLKNDLNLAENILIPGYNTKSKEMFCFLIEKKQYYENLYLCNVTDTEALTLRCSVKTDIFTRVSFY